MRSGLLYTLFIISIFWLSGCAHNKNKVTIVGDIQNMPAETITLEDISANDVITLIDSTRSNENGHFELSADIPEPGLYRLRFQTDPRKFVLLSLDKDNLKITANWKNIENYTVYGSNASQSLDKVLMMTREHIRDYNTMAVVLDSLRKNGNDSVYKVATQDLIRMNNDFTHYIEQYADTTSYAPNAIFAARLLNFRTEKDFLDAFTQSLDRRFPGLKIIKDFDSYYAQMAVAMRPAPGATVAVGAMAPEVTLPDTAGKLVSLSSFRGKYVLLDFWASWCMPCRKFNPSVLAAYNKFKGRNFTILSVSLDNRKDAWQKAIKDDNLAWTQVSDLKGWESKAAQTYNVEAIPANFLIDPSGKIIDRDLDENTIEQRLAAALK